MAYTKGFVRGNLENIKQQDIEADKFYAIKDLPDNSITNAQMELAVNDNSAAAFFRINNTYVCIDSGEYIQNHIYKWLGDSWEDITPISPSSGLDLKTSSFQSIGETSEDYCDIWLLDPTSAAGNQIGVGCVDFSGSDGTALIVNKDDAYLTATKNIEEVLHSSSIQVNADAINLNSNNNSLRISETGVFVNDNPVGAGFRYLKGTEEHKINLGTDISNGETCIIEGSIDAVDGTNITLGDKALAIKSFNKVYIYAGTFGIIINIDVDSGKYINTDSYSYVTHLQGRVDRPINLKNDLLVDGLYAISGEIYNQVSNLNAQGNILLYRINLNSLYLIGAKIDLTTNEIYFQPGYFTTIELGSAGEISAYQTNIAPVNSGTPGQVLTSNGPDEAPTWITPNIDVVKTDASTIPEIYNLLQTKFNENKSISFTLKYIGHILGASVPSYGYDPNSMEVEPYNVNLQLLNDTQRTYLPCKVIGISNSRIQCTFETIDAVGSFEIAENNIYGLSLNYQHIVSEKYAVGCDFNGIVLSSSDRSYGLSIISC